MRSELLVQLNRERISIGNGHDGDQQAKKIVSSTGGTSRSRNRI
jgi:hypothetical protein